MSLHSWPKLLCPAALVSTSSAVLGGGLERAQTALKSRRSDLDLLGQLVEARQYKSGIVGAMGDHPGR
jgi:hypothetical protein